MTDLMHAHARWATTPDDERYFTVAEALAESRAFRNSAKLVQKSFADLSVFSLPVSGSEDLLLVSA